MNRTEKLMQLRPTILLTDDLKSKPEEQFQNISLRAILKFQNEIIIQWFHIFIANKKIQLKDEATVILHEALSKNGRNRQELIGIIMGHFTLEEYIIYNEKSKEYGKRITQMAIERFVSQAEFS